MRPGLDSVLRGFDRALAFWIEAVQRFALAVVVLVAALSYGLYSFTVGNLSINTNTTDMLSEELPFRQLYLDYQKAFPQFADLITVVVEAETPDRADAAALALAARLRQATDVVEKVYDPAGDPFFRRNGLLYEDVAGLEEFTDRLSRSQGLLGALAEDTSLRGLAEVLGLAVDNLREGGDPPGDLADVFRRISAVIEARLAGQPRELSWQTLLSGKDPKPSDLRRFLQVGVTVDWSSLSPAAKGMAKIREMARELDLDPAHGVRVRLTGGLALSTEELASVFEGAKTASILSFVLVSLCLFVGLRSFRLVIATIVTLVAGLVWTAAFATWAVGHLNLLSVAFAVLFIGLGVDFGIHFALRYAEHAAEEDDRHAALSRAARGVGFAMTMCAVSAAIGFYSFMPTAYLGLAELGLISGTSMFIALFMSLTLMPALMTLMPISGRQFRAPGARGRVDGVIRRFGLSITLVFLVLAGTCAGLAPKVSFDFDPLHLHDPTTESVQTALDLIRDSETSPKRISIVTEGPEAARALADRLEKLDTVSKAVSFNDFLPKRQDDKLAIIQDVGLLMLPVFTGGNGKEKPTPEEERKAVAGFVAKLRALVSSPDVPQAIVTQGRRLADDLQKFLAVSDGRNELVGALRQDLLGLFPGRIEQLKSALEAQRVEANDIPADIRDSYIARDGRARVEVSPAFSVETNDALRRFIESVRSVAPNATGSPVVILEASRAVVGAIGDAAVIAGILIVALLLLLLRSFVDTLLVFYPLVLAALLTVGTAVVLDLPFNFANVIVLPLLMGLGVASGIHLVMRARATTDQGIGLLRTSTPRAVMFSALTTIVSFGSLAVSNHRGTASMGELLTIAIGYTLICSLVALPALMAWLERRRRPRAG